MAFDIKALKAAAAKKIEESKAGGDYPAWLELDEGDDFIGQITKIRPNPFFKKPKDNGEVDEGGAIHLFQAKRLSDGEEFTLKGQKALCNKIEQQDPEVGKYLYLHYNGKVKAKDSPYKYHSYDVAVLTEAEIAEMTGEQPATKPTEPAKKK